MLRVVLDTNVLLAAERSSNIGSPNVEIIDRWIDGQFDWLISDDVLAEYAEKMIEMGVSIIRIEELLAELVRFGRGVTIRHFHFRHYPIDADDVCFLLLALNGEGSHLVTYDQHLKDVGIFYPEFKTCEPVPFLSELRATSNG